MKHKIYILFFFFSILSSLGASAQVSISAITNCHEDTLTATLTGLTPVSAGITADDGWSSVVPIGFNFTFYGTVYNQCIIGSNGCLGFDISYASAYNTWLISSSWATDGGSGDIHNLIGNPWCDVYIPAGGTIMYSTVGTSPNRKFECTWCGTAMYSCTSEWLTTQVIIYETTNIAEVHIGHHTYCTSWNGGRAECGVKDATGSYSTVAPGRDMTPDWTATNEGWRFTPAGTTSYTCSSISYAPIPYAASSVYWYDSTTGAYLGTGSSLVVTPTVTTTYMAAAVGCNDTSKAFITMGTLFSMGSYITCFGAVNNGPVCAGDDTLRLEAIGDSIGVTFQWISPGGGVAGTSYHLAINPATYSDSGTWLLIKTIGTVNDTARTHVVVRWKPTLTLTSNAPLCYGMVDTLVLTANPDSIGEAFSWTGPAGFLSALENPTLPGYNALDTGVYRVIATSSFGCKDTAYVDAGIIPQPATPVLTGVTHYCSGDPFVPFTVTGYTGTLKWYTTATGGVASTTAPVIPTSYGGTYTYWVSQVIGLCESLRGSITVTVVVTPPPPVITGISTYCQYIAYVPPTAAGTNILWYTTATGGTGTTTPPAINTSVPGVTTFYADQSDSGCTSPRSSFTITVNAVPLPPIITGDTIYCQGDVPVPFTVTGVTGTLLWYTAATGGVGSTTATPINTATAGVTTYYVSQTNGFCESLRASITVHVHPTPATPAITGISSYCLDDPYIPVTAAATTSTGVIKWYTNLWGSYSLTPPVINTATLGVFTIYATQTDSGCVGLVDSFVITVHPIPEKPSIIGPVIYCKDAVPVPFTVLGVTGTLLWYTSSTGASSTTETTINTAIPGVTTYWVAQTNGFCISPKDSTTVHVRPTPVMPVITGPTTYCQFDSFIYPSALPSGTGVIQWFILPGGVPSSFVPVVSTLVPGVTTIYASQVDSGCVGPVDSIVITVNPTPNQPEITDTPDQYCPGQPFVPFTIVSGANLLWYLTDSGGVGSPATPTINTNIPGTYTYFVTQTEGSCVSDRIAVTVVVFDSVIANFTDVIKLGCNGDSVTCTNLSTGAFNYEWSFGDGYLSNETNPLHIYHTQGTFKLTLYSHSTTCIDSMSRDITLLHPLSASFSVFPSDTVCQNTPLTFSSTVTATLPVYLWNFDDGTTSAIANPAHTYLSQGVYTVSLTVTDFVPCSVTVSKIITVDTQTAINLTVTDSVMCEGAFATFTGLFSGIGNTGWSWNFGDGKDMIKDRNPVTYSYNHSDSFTVTLLATFRICAETSATRKIWVMSQPQVNLGLDTAICPGSNPILLSDITNKYNAGATWLWNTGQTTSSIYANVPGIYTATVDIDGCYATDSIIVGKDCYMDIPNIFTPNGDGVNDYFYPRQYLTRGLTSFKMDIFNRWGELLFETTSLDGRGWDGRFNGADQPQGVYIFIIDAVFIDGQKEHQQGNITLLR